MNVEVHVGNVLDHTADVLISTANPWLNMSGGVNGAILTRCGKAIQVELHDHLATIGKSAVPAGTVVRTSAGPLPFNDIVHAVAIDPFYDSSVELVRETLSAALQLADSLGARTVATLTLATGYGRLSIESFAQALAVVTADDRATVTTLAVVVRTAENVVIINGVLAEIP